MVPRRAVFPHRAIFVRRAGRSGNAAALIVSKDAVLFSCLLNCFGSEGWGWAGVVLEETSLSEGYMGISGVQRYTLDIRQLWDGREDDLNDDGFFLGLFLLLVASDTAAVHGFGCSEAPCRRMNTVFKHTIFFSQVSVIPTNTRKAGLLLAPLYHQ